MPLRRLFLSFSFPWALHIRTITDKKRNLYLSLMKLSYHCTVLLSIFDFIFRKIQSVFDIADFFFLLFFCKLHKIFP